MGENFYKLSKEHHGDISKDASSMEKFREIAEAYETLSNPELRKKYDQEFGATRPRSSPFRAPGRKFDGGWSPKGSFVNGQWVDDEPAPQMKNIEYDLSPERMERVWARYRSRWEKIEEVERMRDLERKRNEFRRKIDEKRARMDQMTEAERDEFLFKLRYLRPDAAEPEESFSNGSQGTRDGGPEREDVGPLEKEPKVEDSQAESTSQRKQEDFEEKMQGGRTWGFESNQNQSSWNSSGNGNNKSQASEERDPFSSGMNREDPGDLGSYAKAWEQGKGGGRIRRAWGTWKEEEPGARIDRDRMQSVKHGIQRKPWMSFGEILVITLSISFVVCSTQFIYMI